MKRRIYGIENEYRIIQKANTMDYGTLILNDPEIYYDFMINGARIYIDSGDLPEYATPECASILDLIRCENAGNKIMFNKLGGVANILKSSRGWGKYTSGCHENYLISNIPSVCFQNLGRLLIPFLVSRQILCGAGIIEIQDQDGQAKYHISQRSNYIISERGDYSRSHRSIINTRYEPHAGSRYFRLHLILGDSNMSDISTFLKMGTTGIILRMIEAGFLKNSPILENSVEALHRISADPTCKISIRIENGRKMTAINLQEWYLLKVRKFFESHSVTKEEKLIIKIWQEILDKLRRNPMECDQEIDWVIKKRLIEQYQDKRRLPLGDKQVRTVAYLYHHLDPEISIYQKLAKKGKIRRLVTDKEIEKMMIMPPQDTRAKLRSKVIEAVFKNKDNKRCVAINWGRISNRISNKNWSWQEREILLEPFEVKNEKIEQLVEYLEGKID